MIVGHSLGAALSSLLTLDIMIAAATPTTIVPKGVRLSVVSFGAPRCGNKRLGRVFWPQVLRDYLAKNGQDSFEEFSVKAFNDGQYSYILKTVTFYNCNTICRCSSSTAYSVRISTFSA